MSSATKLREAIDEILFRVCSDTPMVKFEEELRLVCKAAKAIACPVCRGRGGDAFYICDHCLSDRKEIGIYD